MAQVTFENITITGGMTFDPVTGYNPFAIFGYGDNGPNLSITNCFISAGLIP